MLPQTGKVSVWRALYWRITDPVNRLTFLEAVTGKPATVCQCEECRQRADRRHMYFTALLLVTLSVIDWVLMWRVM